MLSVTYGIISAISWRILSHNASLRSCLLERSIIIVIRLILFIICINFKKTIRRSLQKRHSMYCYWRSAFYSQVENTCMTTSYRYEGLFSLTRHFLFKCLHQDMRMNGPDVGYAVLSIRLTCSQRITLFLRFFSLIHITRLLYRQVYFVFRNRVDVWVITFVHATI